MAEAKRYPNRLGVKGWALGGRWGLERYLYTLHRLTGLGILFYFLLHIFVTSTRVGLFGGQDSWKFLMDTFSYELFGLAIFKWGEFAVFAAFVFHALNGVRLILIELGFAVGKPEEPVYPYKSSLDTQRPLVWIVFAAAAALVAAGAYDFLILSH